MTTPSFWARGLAAGALLQGACLAQESPSEPIQEPQSPPAIEVPEGVDDEINGPASGMTYKLSARTGYDFQSDLDGASGSVARWNSGVDLGLTMPASDRLSITLGLATGLTDYDFTGDTGLLPGVQEPWGDVLSHSIGLTGFYRFDKSNSAFLGLNVSSSGESDASFEDTISGGLFAGYARAYSETLTLGVGLSAQSRLEDGILVIPFPVVVWRPPIDPERRWSVSLGNSPGGHSGVTFAAVGFRANEQLSFFTGIGGEGLGGDFRLADDAPIPGGVGRDEAFPLVTGLNWQVTPKARLSVYAGVAFAREITLSDSNGNTVSKRDVDPTPVIGLDFSISF